jgi:hypothetical protein
MTEDKIEKSIDDEATVLAGQIVSIGDKYMLYLSRKGS